ncbi:MAG: hypothetical protein PVI01_08110 [Gemmatimonadales bacterium]|jgi:cell division septum initiation protein DivIVA
MNKHWVLSLGLLVMLAACGRSTQLAVQAVSEGADGEEVAYKQQVIRMLPYDRDSIFATLAASAPEPEPQPPNDFMLLRDTVASAQEQWVDAEAAWNDMREQMQQLSDRMQNMDRASNEYAQAYRRFDDLDRQVRRLEREKQQYFETFTALQEQYRARADSFNAVYQAWSDAAFDGYGEIVDSLLEARGVEELIDTTDANGWAYFSVPRGTWWAHTRAALVFEELYWNVRYQSAGGADTLILNKSNAEIRPIF